MKNSWLFLTALAFAQTVCADVAVQFQNSEAAAVRAAMGPGETLRYSVQYESFSVARISDTAFARLAASGLKLENVSAADRIQFGTMSFDPIADRLPLASAQAGLKLVQFQAQVKSAWLNALKTQGFEVLQAYPGNSFLIWSAAANTPNLLNDPNVRWVGDFNASFKIDRTLNPSLKGRTGLIENVIAHVYASELPETIAQLAAAGALIVSSAPAQPDKQLYDVVFKANDVQLPQLAAIAKVIMLSYSSPQGYFEDEMSSQIVAGNTTANGLGVVGPGYLSFLNNLGWTGEGVTWAVTDSGVDLTHPEFAGKIAGGYTYPGCPAGTGLGDDNSGGGHGTHVAGIIAGAGTLNILDAGGFNYGVGVAPQARIFAQNPICIGSVPWPPAGGWQETSKRAILGGAIGTNNSWTSGEGTNAGYTNGARSHDIMVRDGNFDTPTVNDAFMIMFSAGNSGPNANTLTSPKEAKNPISVAASRNQRVGSVSDIVGFSSRGPSVDGRILPTITAPGEQIASTRRIAGGSSCGTAIAGTNNNYAFCSGTSMASPHAAGFAALLTQWYRANNSGATPSPALVKALMVNGAIDMAGPAAIPNTSEGWGRINFQNSIAAGTVLIDQTDLLTDVGASNTRVFSAIDAAKPVRITLVWTDAPGAIAANPAQVNDLDLIVDASGVTYLGNVFTAGQSSAGGLPDRKNNIENVYLPSGTASFTVNVRAQNLSGDGVPNLGDSTDQDYALVCSNCVSEPTFTMAPASNIGGALCAGDNTYTPINFSAILGFSTPVQLSSTGLPAGATISFSNTTVAPSASTIATLSLERSVAAGTSAFNVIGTAGSVVRSIAYEARINTLPAAAPALVLPAVDALNVNPANLTLSWTSGNAEPTRYRVLISNSPTMTPVLASADVDGLSYTVPTSVGLTSNTTYYWSVSARSACSGDLPNKGFENSTGSIEASLVRSFKTAAAPGDCPTNSTEQSVFSDNVENVSLFTPSGTGGAWAITSAFPFAGTKAWQAVGPTGVSDLRLDSPAIVLPSVAQGLLLRFHDRQSFEDINATSCYDGGLVEISVAGGAFTQITAGLLTSPYTGNVNAASNPLNGKPAWCGDPRPYLRNVIDLAPYAGQSVNIRFRSGSDSSQGRPEGWNIDNIEVVSCQ